MSNAMLTTARQVKSYVKFLVKQHVEEIKKEIEKEFEEVLKRNVINPNAKEIVLYGENFAFKLVKIKRFKHTIYLRFDVYRRNEVEHKHRNYDHKLGKIFVTVKVGGE